MDTVYYISDIESPNKPIHIKIDDEIGGAILGFSNEESANFYLLKMKLPQRYDVVSSNEIDQESFYGKEKLFIFKSSEDIEDAYNEQENTDWSLFLKEWQ